MDQELKTIRMVTHRYSDLQGLRLVIAGLMLAAVSSGLLIAQAGQRTVLIAAIMTCAAMLPSLWLVDRYYKARFGRIVSPTSRLAGLWLPASMALALILTGQTVGAGQLAVTFAIAAGGALWIAIRDWPLRTYHVLGCAAAAFGASIQFLSLHADSLPRAQAIAFFALGLAYIPVGFLDHRLLTSVMRPTAGEAGLKPCATGEERE